MTPATTPEKVILQGGPAELLAEDERIRVAPHHPGDSVKILQGNRYAHFAPTGRTTRHGVHDLQVFDWAGYTYLAE